ncbi:hypothetical protein JOL62DRAFT_610960 [Phyllosticta paracitricarpa]|uniref:Glycine zipper 2TM domain-containing protein n=1 Tax=Phyllosticta paracitricarpa TaxID=2016321 RepID=A0ABR1NA59_9PEZI
MSDPYNQYSYQQGAGYPPPAAYPAQGGSPYPQQGGYAPPQHQQSWGQQQLQGYDYNNQYQQQQQGYGGGGYGPPAHGGFQNGQQAPAQWGQPAQTSYHDPNNNNQLYQPQPSHQFPQQGAYNSSPYPSDPNAPPQAYGQPGQYGATDPNAAQEGDRGLLGAVGGGIAGHMGGKKYGHGLIGTVVGAVAGSKLEDKFKSKNKHGHQGHHQGGHTGGKFW